MQLHLRPTDEFERVNGTLCRKWAGATNAGTPVIAWVATVQPQTHNAKQLEEFDAELKALPPARRELVSFDIRMVD